MSHAPRGDFLIAFFDVLGFESKFERLGLDGIAERYVSLINSVLARHGRVLEVFGGNVELSESIYWLADQDVFLYMPTYGVYASDSILLWSHHWFPESRGATDEVRVTKRDDPGVGWQHHPVPCDSFLDSCCDLICHSIEVGMPLRGSLAMGEAILDVQHRVFLGSPLIEAARLESCQQFIGAGLCSTFCDQIIPKRYILQYDKHLKPKHSCNARFGGSVLDWPRHWRNTRGSDPQDVVRQLNTDAAHSKYYEHTIDFINYSASFSGQYEGPEDLSLRKVYPQFAHEDLRAATRPVALQIHPPSNRTVDTDGGSSSSSPPTAGADSNDATE